MKKYNVVFDVSTEDDLYEIYTYVAINYSIERAEVLFKALRKTCYKLKTFPLRGHIPQELYEVGVVEFKEIFYKPYRIFYSIDKKNSLCLLHFGWAKRYTDNFTGKISKISTAQPIPSFPTSCWEWK
jgi:toxin ParE1/3/4